MPRGRFTTDIVSTGLDLCDFVAAMTRGTAIAPQIQGMFQTRGVYPFITPEHVYLISSISCELAGNHPQTSVVIEVPNRHWAALHAENFLLTKGIMGLLYKRQKRAFPGGFLHFIVLSSNDVTLVFWPLEI